ncbi:MAG: iron-containing alcohol dehydrogenase [Beijerinckiaceae bacterium]
MEFQLPKIVLEHGAIKRLPAELKLLGVKRPLLATDAGLVACGVFAQVTEAMASNEFASFTDVPENPTVEGCERTADVYRANGCDGLIAIGGGSVIDTVKAVAAMVTSGRPLSDFHGKPQNINFNLVPIITIPTTAGSGSEVSTGAGIHPTSTTRSVGAASRFSIPKLAICDPDLTLTLPPRLTAATGVDALAHCVEGFLSKTYSPLVDVIALDGMARAWRNVEIAYKDGSNKTARAEMQLASVAGGTAIHKGLGPVHALAGTFGDRGFHHGTMVAIAMPVCARLAEKHAPDKMKQVAAALGLSAGEKPSDAFAALNRRLDMPLNMRDFGYGDGDVEEMIDDAFGSHFNNASPFKPTREEMAALVREFYG